MKRVAAPMVGGIVTSFILELLVYPAIYAVWKEEALERESSEFGRDDIVTTSHLGLAQVRPEALVIVPQQQT
jgi:hypothetical protein